MIGPDVKAQGQREYVAGRIAFATGEPEPKIPYRLRRWKIVSHERWYLAAARESGWSDARMDAQWQELGYPGRPISSVHDAPPCPPRGEEIGWLCGFCNQRAALGPRLQAGVFSYGQPYVEQHCGCGCEASLLRYMWPRPEDEGHPSKSKQPAKRRVLKPLIGVA